MARPNHSITRFLAKAGGRLLEGVSLLEIDKKVEMSRQDDLFECVDFVSRIATSLDEDVYFDLRSQRARMVVQYRYWPVVKDLAEALLETDVIRGDEARRIIVNGLKDPERNTFDEDIGFRTGLDDGSLFRI